MDHSYEKINTNKRYHHHHHHQTIMKVKKHNLEKEIHEKNMKITLGSL